MARHIFMDGARMDQHLRPQAQALAWGIIAVAPDAHRTVSVMSGSLHLVRHDIIADELMAFLRGLQHAASGVSFFVYELAVRVRYAVSSVLRSALQVAQWLGRAVGPGLFVPSSRAGAVSTRCLCSK